MEVYPDFKELLALFNKHRVEYLVVGGYALAFHGAPRFTGDLDLYVRADAGNARRILAALDEFGFGSLELTEDDFRVPGKVVQLGVPPIRVDLITSLSGASWKQADGGKAHGTYGDVSVPFIGREAFLANKRATGRTKDLADAEALEALNDSETDPSPGKP
jgi:hypothetical protein